MSSKDDGSGSSVGAAVKNGEKERAQEGSSVDATCISPTQKTCRVREDHGNEGSETEIARGVEEAGSSGLQSQAASGENFERGREQQGNPGPSVSLKRSLTDLLNLGDSDTDNRQKQRTDKGQGRRTVSVDVIERFVKRYELDDGSFNNGFILNKYFDLKDPVTAYDELCGHLSKWFGINDKNGTFLDYFCELIRRKDKIGQYSSVRQELEKSYLDRLPKTDRENGSKIKRQTRVDTIIEDIQSKLGELKDAIDHI